jgi:hypothetical protein
LKRRLLTLDIYSPKEFLDIVENTSKDLNLKIVKTKINWATYQKRKNGDILCYTHIFSTVNTNKKPIKPAVWMLPTSPLPEYVYLTFKYDFDFTFNTKTKEIKHLKVFYSHHNHQVVPSERLQINIVDNDIENLLVSYIKDSILNIEEE